MNTALGKVVSVSGRQATVEVDSAVVCSRCAAGKGCGAGLFGGTLRSRTINVDLPAVGEFKTGDPVNLSISSTRLLYASMLAYGLPLAGALTLLFLGRLIVQPLNDVAGIALAVTGLVFGFVVGRGQLRKQACVQQFVPAVTGRTDTGQS